MPALPRNKSKNGSQADRGPHFERKLISIKIDPVKVAHALATVADTEIADQMLWKKIGQWPTARLDSTFMNERPLCANSGRSN